MALGRKIFSLRHKHSGKHVELAKELDAKAVALAKASKREKLNAARRARRRSASGIKSNKIVSSESKI